MPMEPVPVSHRCRHVGDLVTPRLALPDRAAQPLKRLPEEGLDVMRLQPLGFGALHVFADTVHAPGIHGVLSQGAFFQQGLELAALECVVHGGVEASANLRLFPVAYRLHQEFPQRAPLELELAEDVEHLPAQGFARLFQLVEQPAIDVALAGAVGNKVPQVAHLGLADAVNASEALLQAVGIPGQVVVHHQVRALQVDAFAGGIGRQQHLHLGIVPEGFLRLEPGLATHAAVNQHGGLGASEQGRDAIVQIAQRVPVLGEQDQLLPRRRDRPGNRTGAIGDVRLRDLAGEPGGGEDFAEQARQFPPFGIRTAAAYVECQAFQSLEGIDLCPELGHGLRRRRLIEDGFLGGQDFVIRRLVEGLDILQVERRCRSELKRGAATLL